MPQSTGSQKELDMIELTELMKRNKGLIHSKIWINLKTVRLRKAEIKVMVSKSDHLLGWYAEQCLHELDTPSNSTLETKLDEILTTWW